MQVTGGAPQIGSGLSEAWAPLRASSPSAPVSVADTDPGTFGACEQTWQAAVGPAGALGGVWPVSGTLVLLSWPPHPGVSHRG